MVELVTWKYLGRSGPSGTDSEALQGWLLKSRDYIKKSIRLESFVDCLYNITPSWAAYRVLLSGRLISLDKIPRLRPVGIGETWFRLFDKCMLKVTGPEATHTCKDGHICERLKAVIYAELHEIQSMWGAKYAKENWVFLLLDTKNAFNEINQIRMV